MTEANVEPAKIGKLNGSTAADNGPDPDIEKKIEKEYDSNSAPQESLKVNEAEGKHEKQNEDAKPASEGILKTNGSAGPEVVLGKKTEEENGGSVDEEGSEGKREKEDWGLQSVEVDHGKLQVPSDTKDQGENVAQSDESEVKGVVEVKIPVETKRSEATDAKVLEAEDLQKKEDTEASDAEKPEDDSTAKTEDVKTSEAEDTKISEASPIISDMDKPEGMAKIKDTEISAGINTLISGARNTETTEPQDANISEMEDTEMSECKGSDDKMAKAEDSKSTDVEVTKTSDGKDVNKTLAEDVEMSDVDPIQDVKIAENDSKTLDPGDVTLVEVNDTKALQFEEIKDKQEKEGEVSHADVAEKAEVRNENMTKAEDVEMSGIEHVQDLTELVPPESGHTKTLEANVAILVEAEDAKAPEVEETKDKEEIMGGTREKNGEALDIQSAGTEEATNKSQDDKVLESEHLKDKESSESEDKDMEITEEDVKATGSEGIKEEKEVEEGEDEEEGVKGNNEERSGEARGSKKKRSRGQRSAKNDDEKEKKDVGRKQKEVIDSPGLSSSERPVREKKAVERLVEVLEKEQEQAKIFTIDKGRGTPLKDIPNVARKIARKKPADLKFLHQTLFGRVGKAVDYKIHILQFSGFTWHETEEKQRTKIKEKLDKCVKDTLLDLCDLFNIAVSRATVRKEELVALLLDFIAAPHPILRASLDDKEQQSAKSRKRKRVDKRAKQSKAKIAKSENTRKTKYDSDFESDEDEEDRTKEKDLSSEDEDEVNHSENDTEELASGAEAESDDEFSITSDQKTKIPSKTKRGDSAEKSKVSSPKKGVLLSTVKSPSKISASQKKPEANEEKSGGPKVFSRVKRNTDSPKKKLTVPKLDYEEKAPEAKREARSKPGSKRTKESDPSDEDLRKTMQEILKEVDFNTATFTDIFKQLGSHYKTDLTARKASLKLILQEELTKLAEEAEDSEDDDEGGSEDDKGRGKRRKIIKV